MDNRNFGTLLYNGEFGNIRLNALFSAEDRVIQLDVLDDWIDLLLTERDRVLNWEEPFDPATGQAIKGVATQRKLTVT